MGVSFTIGGTVYADNSISNGRKALDISIQSAGYDIKRFHVPHTDGNLIIRNGRVGQSITCAVRYIGADLATAKGYHKTDREAFENTAVTIVDDAGDSYTLCNLTSFSITSPPIATGRTNGQVFFDAVATFTRDG